MNKISSITRSILATGVSVVGVVVGVVCETVFTNKLSAESILDFITLHGKNKIVNPKQSSKNTSLQDMWVKMAPKIIYENENLYSTNVFVYKYNKENEHTRGCYIRIQNNKTSLCTICSPADVFVENDSESIELKHLYLSDDNKAFIYKCQCEQNNVPNMNDKSKVEISSDL